MLSRALEHKSSLESTLETANETAGVDIQVSDRDWANAAMMANMLEPFACAVETLAGDELGLAELPCIMSVLNSHVKAEAATFNAGPFAEAGENIILDHADRWDELPEVAKVASALSARTKGLEWLSETKRKEWRALLLVELESLFAKDIVAEGARARGPADGGGSGGASGAEQSAPKRKRSFHAMCVATAKLVGAGGGSEGDGASQARGRGESSVFSLPLESRLQAAEIELQRFVHEEGVTDDDATADDDLHWWCRNQFAFPCLARLAVKYLAIPPSAAASERVSSMAGNEVTKKRKHLGDDMVDALVFLNGSHGLAWSSGISQESLGRKKK